MEVNPKTHEFIFMDSFTYIFKSVIIPKQHIPRLHEKNHTISICFRIA